MLEAAKKKATNSCLFLKDNLELIDGDWLAAGVQPASQIPRPGKQPSKPVFSPAWALRLSGSVQSHGNPRTTKPRGRQPTNPRRGQTATKKDVTISISILAQISQSTQRSDLSFQLIRSGAAYRCRAQGTARDGSRREREMNISYVHLSR